MPRVKVAGATILLGSLGVAALGVGSLRTSPEPASIFVRVSGPLLGGGLVGAFLLLPGRGRVALLSTLLSVALLEGICRWTEGRAEAEVRAGIDPDYYQPDEVLGYAPRPAMRAHAWKRVDGRPVYDVAYTIDAAGRRLTPVRGEGERSRFLLLFGGSFVFGEGVSDDETLPYFVGERAVDHVPYNYGFHGYGPQQVLARLESGQLRREVRQPEGRGVYLFIDSHVNRAIGSLVVYTRWAWAVPHYAIDPSGTPVRRGTLTTGRPLRSIVYATLGMSAIVRELGFEIPLWITDDHVEATARLLARASELLGRQLRSRGLTVVIFPGSRHAERLRHHLAARGVETLDYSALLDWEDPRYFIPEDWHPSPLTNRILAERLVEDLGLAGGDREAGPAG